MIGDMTFKVTFVVFVILQFCPAENLPWTRTEAWSFNNRRECRKYYSNMTVKGDLWCRPKWDGVLCWPPTPINKVAFLKCPPPQQTNKRTRTIQMLCTSNKRWQRYKEPTNSQGIKEKSSLLNSRLHPCLTPWNEGDEVKGSLLSYHVNTRIEHRYAKSTVTATIQKNNNLPQDVGLKVTLPKMAYITSLKMEMNGRNYSSSIQNRSLASSSYHDARNEANNAVLVEMIDMQDFEIKINLVSDQVTLYLTYEELLQKVKGQYIQNIYLLPGMNISKVAIDIYVINQDRLGWDYRILESPDNQTATVTSESTSGGDMVVKYNNSDGPSSGTLSIAYYPKNQQFSKGQNVIQREGQYFGHFLSLETNDRLPRMASHTVFVLDVSNSMEGTKLTQLKEGLKDIIKSMKHFDSFEILVFSSDVVSLGIYNGTHYHKAIRRIQKLQPMSYSNLNLAYLRALRRVNSYRGKYVVARQILMITDGDPNQGVVAESIIRRNVLEANKKKVPIFGIGWGFDAQFKLIQRISDDSRAYARHLINEDTLKEDLCKFYEEISMPVLTNFIVTYPEDEVDPTSIIQMANSNFYSGGEVLAVGKVLSNVKKINPSLKALNYISEIDEQDFFDSYYDQVQDGREEKESLLARLWAYLMVQQLFHQAEIHDNMQQVTRLLDQATILALKFGFVTRVTSLIVRGKSMEYETEHMIWDSFQIPPSYHQNVYLEGAIRKPRFPRNTPYIPHKQNYVDMDPHFVVHSPKLNKSLCFDYHGYDGAYINLIRDLQAGIIVTGETTSSIDNENLTYITKLFLSMGKVNITLTPRDMYVDCQDDNGNIEISSIANSLWPFYKKNGVRRISNRMKRKMDITDRGRKTREERVPVDKLQLCNFNSSWENGTGKKYGDIVVTLSMRKKKKNRRNKMHIRIGDGQAHFVIVRSRRGHQEFLGFYLKTEKMFTSETRGLIGQFAEKSISMSNPSQNSILDENSTVELVVEKRNSYGRFRTSHVSGTYSKRRSQLTGKHVNCIKIKHEGKGLLDGRQEDYLLKCLRC